MKKLRLHQEKSIRILSNNLSGLDASEMGTGKTLVAVERVRTLELKRTPRVLVIAPVNTHPQWKGTFGEQYPSLSKRPEMLRCVSTPRSDPDGWKAILTKKPGIFIIGWEAMRGLVPYSVKVVGLKHTGSLALEVDPPTPLMWNVDRSAPLPPQYSAVTQSVTGPVPRGFHLVSTSGASRGYGDLYGRGRKLTVAAVKEAMKCGDIPPWHKAGTWDLVVADESHRMQRRDSTNKLVLKQIKTTCKHASSGTPAGNKPEGLWSTLNWLWPKEYSSFWSWVDQHMVIEDQTIPGGDTVQVIVGEKYPGSTMADIPCLVRWRLSQVADQLPDVIERIVEVPMGKTQRRIYDEFERQALAWIDDNPVVEPLPITQRIRLRQAALGTLRHKGMKVNADGRESPDLDFLKSGDQPKVDALREIIEDLPDGEPVLVFTHSAKWADMATQMLDGKVGVVRSWTGSTSQKRRAELKAAFGKEVRVIVAVVAAIGEGVDGLQNACRCEVWASMSDDGLLNEQAKKRLHRPGQTQKTQRWLLHSQDSIDADVDAHLRARLAQMKAMYRDDKVKAKSE